MTEENIHKMEEALNLYKSKRSDYKKVETLLNRLEDKEGIGKAGVYVNELNNRIIINAQYQHVGNNHWEETCLNNAFNNAIKKNFDKLLEEAKSDLLQEYKKAKKAFDIYQIKPNSEGKDV